MQQVLSLRELGERFGVDVGQLKRLVRVGSLPEAIKEASPSGKRWVIPVDRIDEVARRHGWEVSEINLDSRPEPEISFAQAAEATPMQGPGQHDGALPARQQSEVSASPPMELTPIRPRNNLQPPLPPDHLKVKRHSPAPVDVPALSDIVNEDLLSRLLGAHEDKATAQARVKETERALTSLTASHRHVSMQLSEERKEREILAERLREERNARLQSDAKVAELHQRVARETAIAESEQQARQLATERSIKAERSTAAALGSMSFMSRRKFERRTKQRG